MSLNAKKWFSVVKGAGHGPAIFSLARGSSASLEWSCRMALSSAGAGAWWRMVARMTSMSGCAKARASVVLDGGVSPCDLWRASAVASKPMCCSRICWIRCVRKTDSAMGLVGTCRLVYGKIGSPASCRLLLHELASQCSPFCFQVDGMGGSGNGTSGGGGWGCGCRVRGR